jgi:hypothetical protein
MSCIKKLMAWLEYKIMKLLSHYLGEQLQIMQPSIWKRVYELRTHESVLLTMSYPKWFSNLAVVTGF